MISLRLWAIMSADSCIMALLDYVKACNCLPWILYYSCESQLKCSQELFQST